MSRTARTSCFKTLVKSRLANIVFFSSTTCTTGGLHLDLKVGSIHCVLFHLQSIASMFPLVSQRISMEAPETSSHTLVSPSMACVSALWLPCPLSLSCRFPSKQKKKNRSLDLHLDWFCWAHLPRRSGCKGWSTSGYSAARRTSQSPRDAL